MHPITILSFGYLHPWPEDVPRPADEDIHDLRELVADPAHVPDEDMRDRTGLDLDVADFVFATKGANDLLYKVLDETKARALDGPVTLAFGCAGGRHRSVALAEELNKWLGEVYGYASTVRHLHVHLPRVIR